MTHLSLFMLRHSDTLFSRNSPHLGIKIHCISVFNQRAQEYLFLTPYAILFIYFGYAFKLIS
ncbi:Uncharacterised protein [Vibrio cholerae]|nr:Uncharacterised protein [Vibrio cholerae]